jgi:UDP-N-acetylmuramoyl-tripeptide--D-alanyl-D-alanine ligase
MFTQASVLEALTGQRPEMPSREITGAVIDSRQAIPGALFVALPGEQVDGHDFVQDAFNRGASISLVQQDLSGQFPQIAI